MPVPSMTANSLNALKGWPSPHALDFAAIPASGVTINAGACVSLDSSGNLVLGVGTALAMPLFATKSSTAFDTLQNTNTNAGDPATEAFPFRTPQPSGRVNTLVAVGGFELVTTEYKTDDTFAPNTALTSPTSTANAGKLMAVTPTIGANAAATIVGIVSRGVVTSYGQNALAFWPVLIRNSGA